MHSQWRTQHVHKNHLPRLVQAIADQQQADLETETEILVQAQFQDQVHLQVAVLDSVHHLRQDVALALVHHLQVVALEVLALVHQAVALVVDVNH